MVRISKKQASPRPAAAAKASLAEWDPPPSLLLVLSVAALSLAVFVGRQSARLASSAADLGPRRISTSETDGCGGQSFPATTSGFARYGASCPAASLDDLLPLERRPHRRAAFASASASSSPGSRSGAPSHASRRHPVSPPSDVGGAVTLVCCRTTKGPLSVAVHSNWAPHGSRRFLDMVRSGYFSSGVPFHRCVRGGAGVPASSRTRTTTSSSIWCQFGIGGNPRSDRRFREEEIPDDANWLWDGGGGGGRRGGGEGRWHPAAPAGMKRIPRGYLAYAPPSEPGRNRTHLFAVAVTDVDAFGPPRSSSGGGSAAPWEVPFAELVGRESYRALERIFAGYGENGPSERDLLEKGGSSLDLKALFPSMDYVVGCDVMDEERVTTMEE